MSYSTIYKSQFENGNRIDAEFYEPHFLKIIDQIISRKHDQIGGIAIVRSGTTPIDRDDELVNGPILLKTTDIRNNILSKHGDYYHISQAIHNRMSSTQLKYGDILINIVGATLDVVGRVGYITNNFPTANITQAMALIRIINKIYLPEYIYILLLTKYGKIQFNRLARPTGQFNLNLQEIKQILLPEISPSNQQEIANLVLESQKNQDYSYEQYRIAETFLLKELGLSNFEQNKVYSQSIHLSNLQSVNRIDADYFQPKYNQLISKLGNVKKLSEYVKRISSNSSIIADKEYQYTEISDVDVSNGDVIWNPILGKVLPANAKITIRGGELLVSKVRPTRGAIATFPENIQENHIVSGAFSIFKVPSPTREYLQVVLRSIIGKTQLERPTTGTSYPTITDQDVENVLIPDLPISIQQKISELIKESKVARQKSKELLEQAKKTVEEMIEKRGDNI